MKPGGRMVVPVGPAGGEQTLDQVNIEGNSILANTWICYKFCYVPFIDFNLYYANITF